jgi:hypothetical protein
MVTRYRHWTVSWAKEIRSTFSERPYALFANLLLRLRWYTSLQLSDTTFHAFFITSLFSVPPSHYIVPKHIWWSVQFLVTAFSEHDHLQAEETALWHFTKLYQKSLATSTSSVLFTSNGAISCGPIIKQHVISSWSIIKLVLCNKFWIAFGVISCYIALSRTAGLVFISLISQFIILQTYSRRAMGSGVEIMWKALAVVLFEVPAHHVLGGLRNTTKTSG